MIGGGLFGFNRYTHPAPQQPIATDKQQCRDRAAPPHHQISSFLGRGHCVKISHDWKMPWRAQGREAWIRNTSSAELCVLPYASLRHAYSGGRRFSHGMLLSCGLPELIKAADLTIAGRQWHISTWRSPSGQETAVANVTTAGLGCWTGNDMFLWPVSCFRLAADIRARAGHTAARKTLKRSILSQTVLAFLRPFCSRTTARSCPSRVQQHPAKCARDCFDIQAKKS